MVLNNFIHFCMKWFCGIDADRMISQSKQNTNTGEPIQIWKDPKIIEITRKYAPISQNINKANNFGGETNG